MAGKQKGVEAGLRAQLAECNQTIERLQFDRTALQHRLREQQEKASKDVGELKRQIEEVRAKYAKPPESEKMLEALSKAVLELHIEMKDRKLLKETEEVQADNRALARVNPIVVVSYLRTLLRTRFAVHEDTELDLRAQLKLAEDEAQRNVRSLKDRMASVQATQTRAIAMAEEARVKLEDAEHAKDAALDDTRGLVEQVKADQMTLVLQMRAKGEENEKLQKVISDKDKLLKKQEVKMLQMAEMESQIQSLRAENMLNYKKMQAQHEAKTAQFQNDIKRLVKLEAENARYSERIKQLEAEVKRAKTSYTVMHYLDEQAKSSRLESLYRTKTKAYEEAEIKVKALKESADKFKTEALEWQKKYKTLYGAVEEENNKQSDKLRAPVDVHKKADELSVVYYKDLVHEKDKEIQTLLKRIKRLSAGDLRSRLTSRHSEQERLELSHRVASLSYQLDRAQAAEKELLSTTDAQGTMNKVLPNQQRPVSDFAADTHSDEEAQDEDVQEDVFDDDVFPDVEYEWEVHKGMGSTSPDPSSRPPTGQARRPLSALSRRGGENTSRPQSASSKNSKAVSTRPHSATSRPQSAKRVALPVADSAADTVRDALLAAITHKMDAGEQVQLGAREVARITELETENVRMSHQLKQLKNVMAVSQGAADAYMAVVARLQGDDTSANSAPVPAEDAAGVGGAGGDETWGDGGGGRGGGSKLASAKRGQIAKARQETNMYRPPRPSSAPPGRQPLPQSRPSSATPSSAATQGVGPLSGGISGVGLHGKGVPPRPASALHRAPGSRPGSAMSRE